MSLNNIYVRTLAAKSCSRRKVWDTIDLGSDGKSSRKGEASWKLKSAATVYGFATWWSAELAPGVSLSTAPDAPRTHWEQLYFPLLQPIAAKAGRNDRRQSALAHVGGGGHARCLGGDAPRCEGPRNRAPVAQSR